VTHLLIAVNGTIVKGHEDGTLIATDDVPCMQVLTTALPDGSLPEDGTLIATDDRPLHASAHHGAIRRFLARGRYADCH
jgi:hypothetical protein